MQIKYTTVFAAISQKLIFFINYSTYCILQALDAFQFYCCLFLYTGITKKCDMKNTLFPIFLLFSVSLFASEGNNKTSDSGESRTHGLTEQLLYPSQVSTLNINPPDQKPTPGTSVTKPTLSENTSKNRNKTTRRKKVRHQQKLQLLFSGICLGTALTAIIFNGVAKNQKQKEEKLYNTYNAAGQGSDFDKLWNDVKDARNKTDAYLGVRNAFGITTGAIGIALFFSFSLEKE